MAQLRTQQLMSRHTVNELLSAQNGGALCVRSQNAGVFGEDEGQRFGRCPNGGQSRPVR